MKEYQVEFYHTAVIRYEVMADTPEQAIEKAKELDGQKKWAQFKEDIEINRWNEDVQVYELKSL